MRTCLRCNLPKSDDLFGVDKSRPDNRAPYCRECRRLFESKKRSEGKRNYKKKTLPSKETVRMYMRKCRYNLTQAQYEELLSSQNNKCAICDSVFIKVPHVDHDHTTGVVRGLLCGLCNRGIGSLRDDPLLIQNALSYLLNKNKGEPNV